MIVFTLASLFYTFFFRFAITGRRQNKLMRTVRNTLFLSHPFNFTILHSVHQSRPTCVMTWRNCWCETFTRVNHGCYTFLSFGRRILLLTFAASIPSCAAVQSIWRYGRKKENRNRWMFIDTYILTYYIVLHTKYLL